jgi:hypothetical protein
VALFVTQAYDQSGNTHHVSQGTAGNQPQLMFSCAGANACMVGNGSSTLLVSSGVAISNQPITHSLVMRRTYVASLVTAMSTYTTATGMNTSGNAFMYAGVVANASATENVLHSVQAVYNSTSSVANIDGTETTTNPGAENPGTGAIYLFANGLQQYWTGYITESGIWPIGFSSGNRSSMHTNQSAYWGTP